MCVLKKKTEYTPGTVQQCLRTSFVYGYYDCLSIWSGESLSIDCLVVTRLHPTFPKIFDTTPPPPPKVQCAIYTSGKRPQSQRKGFKVSICPFRDPYVWPQIRESKSNRLEQLWIFIALHFRRVSPHSLVISIFFFFHLIWFVELVILGSSRVFQRGGTVIFD